MLDHREYASVNHSAVEFVCVLPTNISCPFPLQKEASLLTYLKYFNKTRDRASYVTLL